MTPGTERPARFETLPNFDLKPGARLGAYFMLHGMRDFHAAARYVRRLPYGRNSDRSDYEVVLAERRDTYSTKHALLAALAREHDRPVELLLGVYVLNGENTPGVGQILRRHGLDGIPQAHCYLAFYGARVDMTRAESTATVEDFLHGGTIEPEGIGAYRVDTHRRFVREWALQRNLLFEQVWRIRVECILALSQRDSP